MNRSRALAGDTIALAFGTLGSSIVGLLMLPLYTRTLTPSQFGTVDLIITTLGLLLPLIFLAIAEAVVRFAMSRAEQTRDVLRTALTFVLAISAALVLLSLVAGLWLPRDQVMFAAAILVVQANNAVLGAWSRATARVWVFALSGLAQAVTLAMLNFWLLLGLGWGVQGFLVSMLLGNLVGCLILLLWLGVGRTWPLATFDWSLLRRMLIFSVPLVPNVIMWWLMNVSGRYVLAAAEGVSAVGMFGVAARIPGLVAIVSTVFTQAWQLSANRSAESDMGEERGRFFSAVFRHYVALLTVCISTVVLGLQPLMKLVSGPAFADAWVAVPPLLLGALFSALAAFYGAIYTASRDSVGVFQTTVVAGAASVLLNLVLVPAYGVVGAASSIALCFFGLWLLRVVKSQRLTRTTVAPRLIVPAGALLCLQMSIQYLGHSPIPMYLAMSALWLAIVMLFRRELLTIGKRAASLSRG